MKNIKMIIAYDGARYNGWQKQGNTINTIQSKLENTISKLLDTEVELAASGRTDAGVNATGQVANFHVDEKVLRDFYYKEKRILNGMYVCEDESEHVELKIINVFKYAVNVYLPSDIRIISVSYAPDRFHSRLNAKAKHYSYHIDNKPVADIFGRRYLMRIDKTLDIVSMKKAAGYMLGEHDFAGFCSNKKMKKSSVRTIYSIEITDNDGIIIIDYVGNGFLYNMVRILTGTLIEVGKGEREPEDIIRIFETNDRSMAGFLAPAKGLFLEKVSY